jgi:hypothetical protein
MPLTGPEQLALGASAAVESFAGAALLLRPRTFVLSTYGMRAVDPMTLKFARTSGVALASLGVLSGACLVADEAPVTTLAALALYHAGAAANNVAASGGGGVALLHATLCGSLLGCLALRSKK